MDSSFDDVLRLLSKCRDEKTPVSALIKTGDSACVISGFVTEVSSIGMTILNLDSTGTKQAKATISFIGATGYGFQDPREAPKRLQESMMQVFDYLIQIDLASTTQCAVYVRRA
jgi:hypothetical protein